MTRFRVLALALLSVLLLSGRPPEAAPAPLFAATQPERVRVTARLAELNPHLTPGQLERIEAAVARYSAKYDLDPVLVAAVIEVESSGKPWARSPKGALGLMQVMPHMAEPADFAGNLTTVESNVEAGCMILSDNIRRLGEDDGVLAYFWGSEIRGVSYLQRVRAARAAMQRPTES